LMALMEVGLLDVVQPWPNRTGVMGTLKVTEAARALGRTVILGGWNATPIGTALGLHLASGLGDGVVLEHAPTDLYGSPPIRRIAWPEPQLDDGRLALP